MTKKVREKIALFANVPMERVFSMHDCDSVYVIPEMLRGAGIDAAVLELFGLTGLADNQAEESARRVWGDYIARFRGAGHAVTIGIIGKYTSVRDSYASIIQSLEHAGTCLGAKVQLEWVDSSNLTDANVADHLENIDGVIVPGGFGFRGVDGKIACVKYVRESGIPYLGLCYGMQIAVIEYARHLCGLTHANSAEIEPNCPEPVIDVLPEQKKIEGLGGTMRLGGFDVELKPGTEAARLFGEAERVRLRFRHRYEVDPEHVETLQKHGLVFSGKHPTQPIVQILELPPGKHPFFMATQAHPELASRPLNPQPMFVGLVRAAMQRAGIAVDVGEAAPDTRGCTQNDHDSVSTTATST